MLLHGVGGFGLWRAHRGGSADSDPAVTEIQLPTPPAGHGTAAPLAIAVIDTPSAAALDGELPPPPPPPSAHPGDVDRDVANNAAPTRAPNPDRYALAAAASSENGRGVPDLPLTGRRDDQEMHVQLFDADQGYQMQRIRTGKDRESREDVRATPHPGQSVDLASRHGEGRSRHTPGARAEGRIDGTVASPARDGLPHGDSPDDNRPARSVAQAPEGGPRIGKDGSEAIGFERPLLAPGPAATDGGKRSDDVADRADSSMLSSELHPGRIELSHPGPLGQSGGGKGDGSAPAWARHGRGTEAVPAGDEEAPPGASLALQTYRRSYNRYLGEVKRKVDPLWEFPHDLALRLEQGDMLVAFTIRRDGSVKDIKVVKPSGFPEFDRNVVAAIHRAAPFGPLPQVFGSELRVTAPFAGENPVVR
jgi:TonB family protein